MSKLDDLIKEKCPNGVKFEPLWKLTTWDKKFNAVDSNKQPKVIKYYYYLANDLKPLIVDNGNVKILTTNTSDLWTTEELAGDTISDGEVVAMPWGGNPNIQYYKGKFITSDNRIATSNDTSVLNNKFLYYFMSNRLDEIASFYRGSGIKHPSMAKVLDMRIPVPPLEVQNEIVQILDNFAELTAELTAELSNRKKQYEYYRDLLLNFDENEQRERVKWFTISDIVTTKNARVKIMKNNYLTTGIYPIIDQSQKYIAGYTNDGGAVLPNDKYVIFGDHTTCLKYFEGEFAQGADGIKILIAKDFVVPKYLYYVMGSYKNFSVSYARHWSKMASTKVPIPSLEEQERIVRVLDQFDKLANDIAEGLPAEIEAREKQYAYYRDKLLTFEEAK